MAKIRMIEKSDANKSYTFTWWDNEPTADRRPTTSADLKNCLHKETFNAADDEEALKLAVEYLCDYAGDDPEDVADTPEEIWNYFNEDWGYGDPIPMVLRQGRRIVKDSGFYPDDEGDDEEMTKAAKELKTLADSLPKHEARMHLGRCVNCHGGWTKTNYVDELEPDVRKYFKDKGYADNADICPKCVVAAKDYLAKNADTTSPAGDSRANEKRVMDTSEPYEISQIKEFMAKKGWTWNFNDKNNHFWFTKDGHSNIEGDLVPWSAYVLTNGNDIYFGRSLRNWKADMKAIGLNEANSNESFEGWDNWEEVEGLEDALEGIENLTYELRSCVRGAKTHCKDWKSLALYIKGLASNLEDAAELMAYKTDSDNDDESANESDNPVGELFDALKQALDGKGYKVSQFTSDKEFVGQEKPYDGISIENEDPNAYHKNPYRIVLDTDANLFRIFFPHVRRKSVTGQPGSISGIVKFILRDLNLDESKKKSR